MLYIYTIDIYIRRRGLFELYDSYDKITDRLYNIIPVKTYKYNKDITFIKYTNLTYKQHENTHSRKRRKIK